MSIARMIELGVQRQKDDTTVRAKVASGAPVDAAREASTSSAQPSVASSLAKLTAFVPSEVIGIYVAGLGALTPVSDHNKWTMFFVCLLLIPIVMLLNYLIQRKNKAPNIPSLGKWSVLLIFAVVAYVAWAAALPQTPFLAFDKNITVYAGIAVVILSLVMYQVAELLGIVPTGK